MAAEPLFRVRSQVVLEAGTGIEPVYTDLQSGLLH